MNMQSSTLPSISFSTGTAYVNVSRTSPTATQAFPFMDHIVDFHNDSLLVAFTFTLPSMFVTVASPESHKLAAPLHKTPT